MLSLKNSWLARVGIVVLAAVMVEILSIVQYRREREALLEATELKSREVMNVMANKIQETLEFTEDTMQAHLWDIKRSMAHPDSVAPALVRLIQADPNVVGGSLAFTPHYYPSKGRLFRPCVNLQQDGIFRIEELADDYTLKEEYAWVLEHHTTSWTDPYFPAPDSPAITTYLFPVYDGNGKIVAICGLDIDLSWLGDTLNSQQPYPSSFGLLLTRQGELVAGPAKDRTPEHEVLHVMDLINGVIPASAVPGLSYSRRTMYKDPYWDIVEVYKTDEVFARVRRQRRQQMPLILLGLAILAFVINRYARNEKNLREASQEQARIGGELAVASEIQQEMLPKEFPSYVHGSLEPAREVGGDVFDFYTRDGKLLFCIGDVSGKGVPAAMVVSMTHSLFRLVSKKEESPSRILRALNEELCRGNSSNMFMTYFVACLDLYSGSLSYASAGHDRPFVVTDKVSMLEAKSNLPLGVYPGIRFEEHSCTLDPGTTLVLYTDGLTEAMNLSRKEFGRKGIQACLEGFLSRADFPLEKMVSSLSEAAHRHAGEAPQSDDLTILAVRFAPENLVRKALTLVNDTAEVPRLSSFVKEFLGRLEIDGRTASGMRLALEEAVVNVINYAYPQGEKGEISVQADSNGKEVRFTIADAGVPFDPTAMMEPDTTLDAQSRPIGGLGILLSRRLMDSVSYSRKNGQNVLSLTKTIS